MSETLEDQFADWLHAVPSLEDSNPEDVAVTITISLPARSWLFIAHTAAANGASFQDTVAQMIHDVTHEDDFMNNQKHLSQIREEEEQRNIERRRKERGDNGE